MNTTASESGLLSILNENESPIFFGYGSRRSFEEGEVILNQGDANDCLILILSGQLGAFCRSTLTRVTLEDITAGQSIGEMSVLDPDQASVTVTAREAGELFAISRDELDAFLRDHPVTGNRVLKYLATQMARRLRRANAELIRNSEGRFGFDNDF